eukprot:TRINITY_DN157_c1_g1_i1.p1 TRINITY_DN157_c1_g1~~TRINITY_DN157_c1_g1_i1.p1  ORF type:complete len:574 (+),score=112.31 TRINITY_DN157_c1_g1_i1:171-1892(+)
MFQGFMNAVLGPQQQQQPLMPAYGQPQQAPASYPGPYANGSAFVPPGGHGIFGPPQQQQAPVGSMGVQMQPSVSTQLPAQDSFSTYFKGLFNDGVQPGGGQPLAQGAPQQQQQRQQLQQPVQQPVQQQQFNPIGRGNSEQIFGQSGLAAGSVNMARPQSMNADREREDILDQHVAYFLRHNPDVQQRVQCVRKRGGVYEVDGKEIRVEWQYSEVPGGKGFLLALDAGTSQPFADYMKRKIQEKEQARGRQPAAAPQPVQRQQSPGPPMSNVAAPQYGQKPWQGPDQAAGRALSLGQQSTAYGHSATTSHSTQPANPGEYTAAQEDLLDQHVAYFLRHNPQVQNSVKIYRRGPGQYVINGRDVHVEWQPAMVPGGRGHLVAIDPPLRQPFSDYMTHSETGAEYDDKGINSLPLHAVPKEKRMTFRDQGNIYSRLDAMKVAKAQAQFRERAADMVTQGQQMNPDDLMQKYEKTLEAKLGGQKRGRQRPQPQPAGGAPVPTGPGMPLPITAPGAVMAVPAGHVAPGSYMPAVGPSVVAAPPMVQVQAVQATPTYAPIPVQQPSLVQGGFAVPMRHF